ncbi:MAG: hypothetical protein AMS21_07765 [Gemmatimonas sp. SG8_38_2]|nr:MAG: hypothetical protein AMS21_07765 [Gemmatimonas sp. SG8_38_2]
MCGNSDIDGGKTVSNLAIVLSAIAITSLCWALACFCYARGEKKAQAAEAARRERTGSCESAA